MRTTAVLLFTLIPTLAAAQGFEGAVADLQYQKYDSGSFELDSVEGHLDAAWSFGGPFGAQVGLTLGKEIDSSDDIDLQQYNGLAAHLTMDATDSLRLGVMALIDNKTPDVAFYAAEALYLAGPLRVEGRIGDSLDSDDYNLLEARGARPSARGRAITTPTSAPRAAIASCRWVRATGSMTGWRSMPISVATRPMPGSTAPRRAR